MRTVALCILISLSLTACAGVLDNCRDGLRDPPYGSGAPDPHGGPGRT